jgi:hypothetical protein
VLESGTVRGVDLKSELLPPILVPMTSPDTTTSTLRFCCRPPALAIRCNGLGFAKHYDRN